MGRVVYEKESGADYGRYELHIRYYGGDYHTEYCTNSLALAKLRALYIRLTDKYVDVRIEDTYHEDHG